MRRLVGAGLFAAALFAQAAPAGAQAQGAVAGQLVNATPGAPPPAGAEVVLHTFQQAAHGSDRRAEADPQGRFRFDGLEVGSGLTYQLTTSYGGVPYSVEPIRLSADAPEQRVELAVRETTTSDPGLRAARALLVLDAFDRDRQEIAAFELVTLVNPSDRTFTPSTRGPAGPMGLIRFGLPSGALDLRVGTGLDPEQVTQVDRGFAVADPFPPGEREVGFAYRVPYAAGGHTLEKSLPYGAELFRIFVPEGGPELAAAGLEPAGTVDVGGRRFRAWSGRYVAPGTRLAIELRGLPTRPLWRAALDAAAQPGVAAALLALALVGGALWALRTRLRPEQPGAEEAVAPEALLDALADLDDAFEGRRVDEGAYLARRAALKGRLRGLARQDGFAAGVGAPGEHA